MKPAVILFPFVVLSLVSAADILQNPDFELPPSKMAPNSTVQQVPLNENNTIPGWTVQGTVELYYLNSSLAILLAEDGKINQTFIANGNVKTYLLTFSLTLGSPSPGTLKCSDNTSLVVSAPDRDSEFFVKPNYEKVLQLNTYGIYLGSWGNEEPINLFLTSKNTDSSSDTTCWPLVDNLILKTLDQSEGNAAVELTSEGGEISGVTTVVTITEGSSYEFKFMLGVARESCTGDFVVGVQAGQTNDNLSFVSSGSVSATMRYYTMTVIAGSSPNSISFKSYTPKQTADGIFCGPLIDGVTLRASDGHMINSLNKCTLVALLLLTLVHQFFNLFFPL